MSYNNNIVNKKHKYNKTTVYRNIFGTLMVLPPFIGFLFFTIAPMLTSLGISFTELHSYRLEKAIFIGFENYVNIFTDKEIHLLDSLFSTFLFSLTVPINLSISLYLANLMNKKNVKLKKLWVVILFLPQVCSTVASTMIWQWIFSEDYGLINSILYSLGLSKVKWMTVANNFSFAILVISIWQQGTNIVLLSSAFANLNINIKESAMIDGATERQIFWKITFPQLTPTLFYLLTMNLIAALQEMAIFNLIASNPMFPGYRPLTLVNLIYTLAFSYTTSYGLGISCALSWVVAIFIYIITRLNFKLSDKWVSYD